MCRSFRVWEDFGVGVAVGIAVAVGLGKGDSASDMVGLGVGASQSSHEADRLAGYMQFPSREGQQFCFDDFSATTVSPRFTGKQSLRKILIAISAMAHSRTNQNELNAKETYALDNLYYSSGSLAAWLHHSCWWQSDSFTPRNRFGRAYRSANPRSAATLSYETSWNCRHHSHRHRHHRLRLWRFGLDD
jgi:hypothetical protein